MAILYRAELRPSKIELLNAWLATRDWAPAGGEWRSVATFRFDDPAGDVGIESFILTAGGDEYHVPLTYRGAPLAGAEEALAGTMEHSVLGSRWVYDGCGDPVYAHMLATTMLTGGHEAELIVETDAGQERLDATARVRGSGGGTGVTALPTRLETRTENDITTIETDVHTLHVARRVGAALPGDATATLTGEWSTKSGPVVLASLAPRA